MALLVDLDVSPAESPALLVSEARRGYPDVPLMATAGVDARARLLDALCETDVNHVIPKRGALTLPRGGMPVLGSLEGPDEHDLFAAVRRLLDGPRVAGRDALPPRRRAGARGQRALERGQGSRRSSASSPSASRWASTGEKLRRVELAAEELLMNALYDAPRNSDGGGAQRRARSRAMPVALGADETVHMRYGCDGQTLAVAVADPFGSLSKKAVTDRLRKVREGIPKPNAGVAGAGLGLVMTYSVANQLIFAVCPGRLTEVTAVLHVGGSNRAAQERGTAVHFYVSGSDGASEGGGGSW